MRCISLFVCCTLSVILFSSSVNAVTDDTSADVLFIGNSYTYYHSMPQMFKAMAEDQFPDQKVKVKFIGTGGATLKQHWDEETAIEEIRSGRWDFVVLQEQSMLGGEIIEDGTSYVRSPDQFFIYAAKFADVIRKNGAQTVFFMTWSKSDYPHQQKYLTYAYMLIARETGSKIAPVGMAWDNLRTNDKLPLYEKDGSHPSIYGSYLTALMLFSIIFDTDTKKIPVRLNGYEILRGGIISKTERILADLPDTDVYILKNAVSAVFKDIKANDGYLDVEKAVSDKKPSPLSYFFNYVRHTRGQFVVLLVLTAVVLMWKGYRTFYREI